MSLPLVVAITGASGAPYAVRLLQALAQSDCHVHLTISPSGAAVIKQELGLQLDLQSLSLDSLLLARFPWEPAAPTGDSGVGQQLVNQWRSATASWKYHHYQDYMTPIASGSFLTAGMIICPCSGSTLSGIARAAGSNLIQRAAEVHLKERRKLVVVPRETPLSTIALENMQRLSQAGAVVLPAMPGWYHGVQRLDDLINFVVARILDQFGLGEGLIDRWGAET